MSTLSPLSGVSGLRADIAERPLMTHVRQALVGVRLHLPRNFPTLAHKFLQALSSDTM